MLILTLPFKGPITLPPDMLQHLGIGPGDKVVVERCLMAASN